MTWTIFDAKISKPYYYLPYFVEQDMVMDI